MNIESYLSEQPELDLGHVIIDTRIHGCHGFCLLPGQTQSSLFRNLVCLFRWLIHHRYRAPHLQVNTPHDLFHSVQTQSVQICQNMNTQAEIK